MRIALANKDVPSSLPEIFPSGQFLQDAFGHGLPRDFVAFVVRLVPKLQLGNVYPRNSASASVSSTEITYNVAGKGASNDTHTI